MLPTTPAGQGPLIAQLGMRPGRREPINYNEQAKTLPCGVEVYRESFLEGSDELPGFQQIAAVLAPILFGFLVPWGSVRIAAWVAYGFLADRSIH
jgi:hypothetical protein